MRTLAAVTPILRDPEASRERIGDWGGPETVWALLFVADKACHKAKRRVRVYSPPSMLEPVHPEAVLPDRALYLPTFSHFLIVNKSLSLSLSLSRPPGAGDLKTR